MARYKNARTNKKGGNGSTGNRFGGPADQAKPTASHKKKSKLVITFDAEKRTYGLGCLLPVLCVSLG